MQRYDTGHPTVINLLLLLLVPEDNDPNYILNTLLTLHCKEEIICGKIKA